MPRNPVHRLGSVSARLVRDGVEVEITGHEPFVVSLVDAKRLAATLAAAFADSKTMRRGC